MRNRFSGQMACPLVLVVILLSTVSTWAASPAPPTGDQWVAVYDPAMPEELRVRDGLPNVFAKLKAGAQVRIAYLGGSITAANGWRPKTLGQYHPNDPRNMSLGRDPTPRCDQSDSFDNSGYPFTNTITDNTPKNIKEALTLVKNRL